MAGPGDDFIFFSGALGQLTVTMINPYSGEEIDIDEEKNINNTTYDGGAGNDTLLMTNLDDALFLTDSGGTQVISNIETIVAGDGDDIVNLAHSTLTYGDVVISGGSGNDILWSNIGNDQIFGAGDHDIIDGGAGNDLLDGGAGNDEVSGGEGDDTVDGGEGDDTLIGGSGSDTYIAGEGHDIIDEAAGVEINTIELPDGITFADLVFTPGEMDLHITVGSVGSITIYNQYAGDGSGIDTLVFSDTTSFDLRTVLNNHDPEAHDDEFTIDENTQATGNVLDDNGNGVDEDVDGDTLSVIAVTLTTVNGGTVELLETGDFTYTPAANFVGHDSFSYTVEDGNGGSDVGTVDIFMTNVIEEDAILGTSGDDKLKGTADDDIIYGFEGDDALNGMKGNDTLHGGDDNDVLKGGAGDDILNGDAGNDISFGNNGNDIMDGGADSDRSLGNTGDDVIDGGSGDDELFGNGGNDTVNGGSGHDEVNGGSGDDDLFGGDGNDVLYGMSGDDELFGEADNDILYGDGGADMLDGGTGDDELFGGSDSDTLNGGADNDILHGGSQSDILNGDDGLDVLYGDDGHDTLNGGAGNDILIGGLGRDVMDGGEGSDTFLYEVFDTNHDTIVGFESGLGGDVIDIADILSGYDSGSDNIADFVRLLDNTEGDTRLQVNVDGDSGGSYTTIAVFEGGISDTLTDLINNGNLVAEQV